MYSLVAGAILAVATGAREGVGVSKYESYQYKFFGGSGISSSSVGQLDWISAHRYCRSQGGVLASVHSSDDNDRVFNACWAERCWMGINDRQNEGVWGWSDGSTLDYHRWAPHEPDNTRWAHGDEDCGYLHGLAYPDSNKHKQWGDHPCKDHMSFVCQIPVNFREIKTPTDWATAEQGCNKIDGHLADIQSAIDNDNVFGACKEKRCWVGLNDRAAEGTYQWTDGTSLDEVAYKHWAQGEPSNTQYSASSEWGEIDEDCVYIHGKSYPDSAKQSFWGDHPCPQKMASVCQVPAQFTTQFFSGPADWATAEKTCQEHGGHLVHIQSFGENGRALEECEAERCWMGLNDQYREGDWQYSDQTALGLGYVNWVPGEPDDTMYPDGVDEDCAYMHGLKYPTPAKLGKWGDHKCTEKMAFLCQIPILKGRAALADDQFTPEWGEVGGPGGPSNFSNFFWFVILCVAMGGAMFVGMQKGYIKEQHVYAAKRGVVDCVLTIKDKLTKKAVPNNGEYALMSEDGDDPMAGDELISPTPSNGNSNGMSGPAAELFGGGGGNKNVSELPEVDGYRAPDQTFHEQL